MMRSPTNVVSLLLLMQALVSLILPVVSEVRADQNTEIFLDGHTSNCNSHQVIGTYNNPGKSCANILQHRCEGLRNGIYWITSPNPFLKPFPVFCDMKAGGWTLIFKAVAGVPVGISQLWQNKFPSYEYSLEALNKHNSFRHHYKNNVVQNWESFNPSQARVVLYKDSKEEAVLRFNAHHTGNMNWFSMSNLQESPWADITKEPKNYFSLLGIKTKGETYRNFHINLIYDECPNDVGWLSVGDSEDCPYEKRSRAVRFIYSKVGRIANYNEAADVGLADVFAVYVR